MRLLRRALGGLGTGWPRRWPPCSGLRRRHPGLGTELSLSNTGSQAITSLNVTLEPYADGRSFSTGGHAFDLGAALPPGGVAAGAHFSTRWDADALGADCLRITGIKLGFIDGGGADIGVDKVDDYLAPVINKHCTAAPLASLPTDVGGGKSY